MPGEGSSTSSTGGGNPEMELMVGCFWSHLWYIHPAWPKEEKSTGPPLPPNWVRVPHEGDHYYWNTQTNEASLTWTSWINLMFDLWSSWFFMQFPFCWTPCSVVVVCRSVGSIQSGSWFIFSHSLLWCRDTNHKAEQAMKPKAEKKPKFTEEHKVLAATV